ncbi:uncharacterized protein LOC116849998 [Odontomachus brunneus]|uniref:uncharacterized protein LOC116849998 n=1 Tax=Odontomachus brunneus TaxID=486640 RepID=UPI0013F25DDF|nr:uncharacterized protein LOC116849998 [Odontomachus brunneus]
MKTIGRILACVLLAAVFAKNVLAWSAGNIEFPKERAKEIQAANVTRLRLISRLDSELDDSRAVLDDTSKTKDDKSDRGLVESRTFGIKRLQFMLMPLMYKMGVMMTMLMVLTAVSVKGLFIGIILLVLKLSAFLAKFHSAWHHHAAPQEWSPPQPIHVHVHNSFPYTHTHGWAPSGPGMDEQHYYYKGCKAARQRHRESYVHLQQPIVPTRNMAGTMLFACNIILWLATSSKLAARAEERQNVGSLARPNMTQSLNVFPGVKLCSVDGEVVVRVRMRDLLQETEVQGRKRRERTNILQRLGYMMMMTPFVMQVLSLPGAIASIKMSLLRSVMVAQLAIAIMFYNLIRSTENADVVVVRQPQHHAHYYHSYHPDDEDEWFDTIDSAPLAPSSFVRASHSEPQRDHLRGMSSFMKGCCVSLCLLLLCRLVARHHAFADQSTERPYEFSFNILDFQHRFEKKDADGLINGEYGFITADGVYHETAYATDKNGDFIITRMRNRKITSLKDAQEIFKDRPEAAKKLVEAISRACSGCKIVVAKDEEPAKRPEKRVDAVVNKFRKENVISMTRPKENVVKNVMREAKKLLPEPGSNAVNDQVLEKMANDLYYQFNYTITTHGHNEDGYRSGRKDGSYRSQSENGVETRVKYLSNEFGHQPNITFAPRASTDEEHALKGYSFRWYWP